MQVRKDRSRPPIKAVDTTTGRLIATETTIIRLTTLVNYIAAGNNVVKMPAASTTRITHTD